MSKKNKPDPRGYVFSTDPSFSFEKNTGDTETLSPKDQALRVKLDTKHRAGKTVTIVWGFEGKNEDLETLGKQLKNHCGTGGSVKDGEIIVQGDHRDKIILWLRKNGYTRSKKS